MVWTDGRTELLKKLWADGLSASRIAAQLGGVTRNSVIGKVHRLGLSGRTRSPSSGIPRVRKSRDPNSYARGPRMRYHGHSTMVLPYGNGNGHGNGSAVQTEVRESPDPLANAVPQGPHVSIVELTESTCRWPIGDPGTAGFYYCGSQSKEKLPYCPYHARVAFQPLAERRRQRAAMSG